MLLNCGLEKNLKSPLDCKEIKLVNPKGNLSWIFTGRTDAEAEIPIFWPTDAKNWLIRKDPDAGKDWRWEEKGTRENEESWWWTGKSGVLQSMGSQRVGHDWATELTVGGDQEGQDTYSFSLILSSVLSQFFALDWISFNCGWQIKLLLFNRKTTTWTFRSLRISDFRWKKFLIEFVCSFLFNFQIGLYQKLKKLGKKAYFLTLTNKKQLP